MIIELNAPITAVTVYTDRARVTRSAELELSAGKTVLMLSGLPAKMDKDSVRVSGKGAGITIRGVDVKSDVQEGSESSKSLHEKKKQLKQDEYTLNFQWQALNEQIAYYQALKLRTGRETGELLLTNEASFARANKIARYIGKQMQDIYEQQRQLLIQRDDLLEELEELNILISRHSTDYINAGYAIHIAVNAEQDTTFIYEIDYIVGGAFWKPLYDLRLLKDNSVELTYMAQIIQETREDWDNVNIALSTARPALSQTLPEAKPWNISRMRTKQEIEREKLRNMKLGAAPMKESMQSTFSTDKRLGTALKRPAPQATVQQATIDTSSFGAVVTYTIGTPITILGNGEPHKTTITINELKAELDYVTVPRIAQEAYLRATITNTSQYTILPGEASIFHDNDFVGKTHLKTISPAEEFKVQLGVDDRIKIERELLARDTGKNMIGTRQQVTYRYAVMITNLLQKSTKISVQDGYPLPDNSEIKVKLENVSPAPDEESDLHILTWELDLPDDKQRTITMAFTIDYGSNQAVYGLDD